MRDREQRRATAVTYVTSRRAVPCRASRGTIRASHRTPFVYCGYASHRLMSMECTRGTTQRGHFVTVRAISVVATALRCALTSANDRQRAETEQHECTHNVLTLHTGIIHTVHSGSTCSAPPPLCCDSPFSPSSRFVRSAVVSPFNSGPTRTHAREHQIQPH